MVSVSEIMGYFLIPAIHLESLKLHNYEIMSATNVRLILQEPESS